VPGSACPPRQTLSAPPDVTLPYGLRFMVEQVRVEGLGCGGSGLGFRVEALGSKGIGFGV